MKRSPKEFRVLYNNMEGKWKKERAEIETIAAGNNSNTKGGNQLGISKGITKSRDPQARKRGGVGIWVACR